MAQQNEGNQPGGNQGQKEQGQGGSQNPGGQQGGQQGQQSGNESNKDWNQRQGNNPPQGNNPSQGSDQRDVDLHRMLDDQEAVLRQFQDRDEHTAAHTVEQDVAQRSAARTRGGFLRQGHREAMISEDCNLGEHQRRLPQHSPKGLHILGKRRRCPIHLAMSLPDRFLQFAESAR